MNFNEVTQYYAKFKKHTNPRFTKIANSVMLTIQMSAPTKPYEAEEAKSLVKFNDIGSLVSGVVDEDADMPWLTKDVLRVLWNQAARFIK